MEELKKDELQNEFKLEGLSEKEAKALKKLLQKFIKAYGKKDKTISDEQWLKFQFLEELPELTDEQAEKLAAETVAAVQEYDDNLKSVNEATTKGISKEQWLADNIAKASSGMSVVQYGEYLNSIDTTLTNANAQMMRTVTTNAGNINMNNNLDGFIAEQFMVNSFNKKAALEKSQFFAEVKVPESGEAYGKNSFDIVIRDANNSKATPVHQYQVKYGSDAKTTIKMLKDSGSVTKYSNQQIVVPPEQVAEVQAAFPGKTVVSQIGGTDRVPIKSESLSKAEAKEMQLKTQAQELVPTTDWNSFQTKELALNIGKNASLAGMQAAVVTAGVTLAANVIRGEEIDNEEVVTTALKTGADTGIKAAAAGAVKVGVEKGIIGSIPKGTSAGTIVNIVCVGVENVKIMAKVAKGEITMAQALDMMGKNTIAMVYGIGWGKTGAILGAVVLSWVPIVGPIIGGTVGGILGYMGGSKVGEAIYKGAKAVAKAAKTVCKTAWNVIKSGGEKIVSGVKNGLRTIFS